MTRVGQVLKGNMDKNTKWSAYILTMQAGTRGKNSFSPGPVDGGDDTGGVILIALKFF
jgi:hypothetical protein